MKPYSYSTEQSMLALPYHGTEPQEAPAARYTTTPAVSENTVSAAQTASIVTADSEVTPTTTAQATAGEETAFPVQPIPETDTADTGHTEMVTPTAQATPDEGASSPEQPMPMRDTVDTGQTATEKQMAQAVATVPSAVAPVSLSHASVPPRKCLEKLFGKDISTCLYNHIIPNCKLYYTDNKQYFLKYDNDVSGFALFYSAEMSSLLNRICTKELKKLPVQSLAANVSAALESQIEECGERKTVMMRSQLQNQTELYYGLSANCILEIKNGTISNYKGNDIMLFTNSSFCDQIEPNLDSPAEALPRLIDSCFNIEGESKLLFYAHLVALFLNDDVLCIPIMLLTGSHGSAKTTALNQIQMLVDPRTDGCASASGKKDDLAISLNNSGFLTQDNISEISKDQSDLLCQAITGGTYKKRVLYTDSKEIILKLKTNIALTSVTNPLQKSDLAERTDIINLKPLHSYIGENDIAATFNAKRADILGSILNVLRKGLPMYPEMKKALQGKLPRMADYVTYGAAFNKAMGLDPFALLAAYKAMISQITGECADDLTLLVYKFAMLNTTWSGTATQLDEVLRSFASQTGISYKVKGPARLSTELKKQIPDLSNLGVGVDIKTTTPKCITINYTGGEAE